MKPKVLTLLGFALLCSCSESTEPEGDAGSPDSSADVLVIDAGADTPMVDAGSDSSAADVGPDSMAPPPPRLTALVVEADGVVVPFDEGAFDSTRFAYEAEVGFFVREVSVTATSELDVALTIGGVPAVSGEPLSVELALGDNDLSVVVTNIHTGLTTAYALTVDRVDTLSEDYIKSDPIELGAEFGGAVAMAGDVLVIGSEFETSTSGGANAGAAYIFERDGSEWALVARVEPDVPEEGARFGHSVATDGARIAIGAFQYPSAGLPSGAVYVFHRVVEWEQSARILSTPGVQFGSAVAIHERRMVVGGVGASTAFTYHLVGTTNWEHQAFLMPPARAPASQFGNAIVMNEDTLVIAALRESAGVEGGNGGVDPVIDGTLTNSGAVYIYTRAEDGMSWVDAPTYLKAFVPQASDRFGTSIALEGDVLAVGAPGEDSETAGVLGPGEDVDDARATDSGAVYTFRRDADGAWSPENFIKAEAPENTARFGTALAAWGNLLFVGAAGTLGGPGEVSTYVHVGEWTHAATRSATNSHGGDEFGSSVGVSEHGLVVGAPGEASEDGDPDNNRAGDAGAAYSFSSSD